jgi:hypothetical protein
MEELFDDDALRIADVHSVYESLFLRAVGGFESFLEGLFLEIMRENISYPRKRRVAKRVTFSSRAALMDVLLQGAKYLDWLPIKRTQERADRYLLGGRPFADFDGGDRSMITTIVTIRNAIAHESAHSAGEFRRIVTGGLALLHGEKKPAGFLRSNVAPTQKRIQVYFGEMLRMAQKVC